MKKLITLLAVIGFAMTAISQDITLRFRGVSAWGTYIRLDSVTITNINANRYWSETLIYPDTVLTFQQTGITDVQGSTADIAAYPNPFNGTTNVAVTMPQSGEATLQVYNLAGQRVAERTMSLEAGKNLFEVRLQTAQVYLLAVTTAQGRSTVKLLNRGSASENEVLYCGSTRVADKRLSGHSFLNGDALSIIGYATADYGMIRSRDISYTTIASNDFNLEFTLLPTVTTTSASNITSTTATSGGNVTNDGGSAVTARGVCWSTSSNPTISDSHTTDSSGIGQFTSNITGLTAGTTYYIRAYATNSVGTVYGSEDTFTTALVYSFSVSANDSVLFSPGNLQWSSNGGGNAPTTHVTADSTSAGTWRFAPNQWDHIGSGNGVIGYSGWIDLFGWATSGYDNKNADMRSSTSSDYGNGNNDISNTNSDWGVYNAINNPRTNTTDAPGTWRTLKKDEWVYLLNTRSTASGVRYAKATVNGVHGLVIVPDNWDTSTYALDSANTPGVTFSANVITSNQWTTLEDAGCAFLPAAGDRIVNSIYNVGVCGFYWSATHYTEGGAYLLLFYDNTNNTRDVNPSSYNNRKYGCSVRLVKNAN